MSTQSENDNMVTGEAGHRTAFLDGANAYYIEQLYEQYLSAPETVNRGWKEFFDNLGAAEKGNKRLRPSWEKSNWPETPALCNIIESVSLSRISACDPVFSRGC